MRKPFAQPEPPETAEIPWIDIHQHTGTLSWEHHEKMDASGARAVVMIAASYFQVPYRPIRPDDWRFLWDEALRRAEAYHRAGADAILIHSKRSTADEIFAFARHWAGRAPLVIVPTMYYATPTELFREAGISTVIWANHLLRSAIVDMRDTAARITED